MTPKENLYYLIENYRLGNYDCKSFSEQFVLIFSEGVEDYTDKKEKKAMQEVCRLAERYSPYEEDLALSPFFVSDDTFRELFNKLYKEYFSETNAEQT